VSVIFVTVWVAIVTCLARIVEVCENSTRVGRGFHQGRSWFSPQLG